MKQFTGIGLLVLVGVAGWKIGEHLSSDALGMVLGVIFGMMAGIPAALIAITASRAHEQRMRHDHYHHNTQEAAQEPQKQPVAMIAAQPQRYIVVGEQTALPVARKQIEVSG